MIKIFGATDKIYTSNGDIVLQSIQADYYPQLVETLIELRYNVKQEIAVNRQRDTKIAEWEEYNRYCEACKAEAKRILGLEED